jgi:hypothetical protein
VIEARRGEVYATLYYQQSGQLQEQIPGMVMAPEALCALIKDRTLFLGSGVQSYGATFVAMLGDRAVCMDTGVEEVGLAVSLARVAQTRLQAVPAGATPLPKPLYIRPVDARLPRQAVKENNSSSLRWSAPLEEQG